MAMDRSKSPERTAAVVAIECVAGSSRTEEWGEYMLQTGDVVEEIRIGGDTPPVRAPFKGGKAGIQKMLHAAFKRGDTAIHVRAWRGQGVYTELKGCIVPHALPGRRQYMLRSIHDPNYAVGFVDRSERECIALQSSRSSWVVSALSEAQVQDGYVSYPWEEKMSELLPIQNSSISLSLLILPMVSDSAASRYNPLEDTLARANAWLHSSQASGVPIMFMNVQTEALLTKISGETAFATVDTGTISELSMLANVSLYGFEDYHGVDIGVVRAVRLWYTPAAGELAVEVKLHEGDTRLGFAINRTEEGFIFISAVLEDDGDNRAPSTRSGIRDLYKEAAMASKLLVISRVANKTVLPWMVSSTGAIRCFDTVSLSQKLSLHRHALQPILIHVLLWEQRSSGALSRGGGRSREGELAEDTILFPRFEEVGEIQQQPAFDIVRKEVERMKAKHAVSSALARLGYPLIQQAALRHEVRDRVDCLQVELRWLECFLDDPVAKRLKGNDLVFKEAMEVTLRAEKIMGMLVIDPQGGLHRRRRGILIGPLKRYAALTFQQLRARRHKVGAEIEELIAKIGQIKLIIPADLTPDPGQASTSAVDVPLQAKRRASPADYLQHYDTVVVGLDTPKKMIMEQLLDASIERRFILSIVGQGGIGKTTLAKMVYNSRELRTRFDSCTWVSVSQDYRVVEIARNIARQVMGKTIVNEQETMEIGDLMEKLCRFLKKRSYFLVLDDVWRTDVWEEIRAVLPDVNNGSRVLVTTRSMDVARAADPSITSYQLPLLNEEESWELFLNRVFLGNHDVEQSYPEELEGIGRQIIKRCRGLPLALQVLGGLLSTRGPDATEWIRVANRIRPIADEVDIRSILHLSFHDLPNYTLKSCFLYLSAFPKDWEINVRQLIQLWIAEDFIPHTPEQMMEDTAQDYLEELAQRSMIQVVSRDLVDGTVVKCQIHDLFREFCLREVREIGFLNVYSTYNMGQPDHTVYHTVYRLALDNLTINEVKDCHLHSNLTTLLVFGSEVTGETFNRLKFLRVIHFKGTSKCGFERPPEQMKSMIHLQYLGLSGCRDIRKLPSSIGNLRNLQTLDVADTSISSLPKGLGEIQTMRHMYLPSSCACPPIGNLINLLTLMYANSRGGWIEQGFEKLVNIRDFRLHGLKATQVKSFLDSLGKLKRLSSLELLYTEIISFNEFITVLSNHNHLHRLYLDGPLSYRVLPYSHDFPPNLIKLTLRRSELVQDPMAMLEKLPNLRILELDMMSYIGKELICSAGGFSSLQILYLAGLERLQDWRVAAGAMPKLTSLTIRYCWRLPMLPEGLQHIKSLQHLEVADDREEFRSRFLSGEGEDWYKIQHVASIIVRDPRFE